jgi:hypothetical protein
LERVSNENDVTVTICYLVSNGNDVTVTVCGNDAHLWAARSAGPHSGEFWRVLYTDILLGKMLAEWTLWAATVLAGKRHLKQLRFGFIFLNKNEWSGTFIKF